MLRRGFTFLLRQIAVVTICCLASALCLQANAQAKALKGQAAIFWNAQGYLAAQDLAYASSKMDGFQSIDGMRVHEKRLVLHDGGARNCIPKDSLFGYRLSNQKCYRWDAARQEAFEILECKAVVIYQKSEPQYTSKGYVLKPVLYFSRALDSKIWPLTPNDVKRAFPEAHALHIQLDLQPDAGAICQVDPSTRSYKIQQLIEKYSLQSYNNSQQ